MQTNILIFASGSGSNAERFVNYFSDHQQINVAGIVCNRKGAFVFERAEKLNVPAFYVSKSQLVDGKLELSELLSDLSIDYIVLAGFLLKVPEWLIAKFPDKIFNIHPSLLPKFGGKGMYGMHVHRAVLAEKEQESGMTIHLVNEEFDKGKILFQAKTPIHDDMNAEDIAKAVQKLEYLYYPELVESYILNQLS